MSIVAINAKNPEEIRVATFNNSQVSDLYIENTLNKPSLKDIYAGVIRSIEPSLEAVFVEYGAGRHGFLQFKDVALEYCKDGNRRHLKTSLKVGQYIIVQVKKEEREGKGAALTTYITLPGTYLVLMPNHPSAGGVSKQITMDNRKDMQELLSQLELSPSMSVILRTAGAGRPVSALQRDLSLLLKQWEEIKNAFKAGKAPFLIFQEGDILARTIRDYAREDVTQIIVDDPETFEKTKRYAATIRPELANIIQSYKGRIPLFLHLGIEDEVESAFHHSVRLPSGGSIILDRAAAGVMIDVNSGSSTKHEDITETALRTNLEAAAMIARQLRLRDLGGLILIDFIGMKDEAHKKQIEAKLWESIAGDRARIQIGHILPRFDVLVMSRQRLRSSLGRVNEDTCKACQGQGSQRSVESLALSILRTVEKKLFSKKVSQVSIEASVALATYLGNEKRTMIYDLEQTHRFRLLLLPNPHWETSQYKITELASEEWETKESVREKASYTLLSEDSMEKMTSVIAPTAEVPAVERFKQSTLNQSVLDKLKSVKKALVNILPWGESKENVKARPVASIEKRSRRSRPSPEAFPLPIKSKKAARSVIKAQIQTAPNKEKPVASVVSSPPETLESQVANKVQKSSISTVEKSNISNQPIDKKESTPVSAATRPVNARTSVNRYGGEPRLNKRGF